jgi:multicomponent Na+:H+ antiporter subunit F
VSAWTIAAVALLAAYVPALVVCLKGPPMDRLVGFQMSGIVTVFGMLVLAEALSRPNFVDLAFLLALLSLPGGLALSRVMERWT